MVHLEKEKVWFLYMVPRETHIKKHSRRKNWLGSSAEKAVWPH
jgi:hypothetical protein